ncbi:MAG: hypothetical protein SNJ69_18440 [Chloroflexaceae bacterium]
MERPRVRQSIPPGSAMRGRATAPSPSAVAAERLALEREQARLERELAVWRRNQARAESRLRQVTQRLAALAAPAPDRASGDPADRARPGASGGPYSNIVVEY